MMPDEPMLEALPNVPHEWIRNFVAWAQEHELTAVSFTLRRLPDGDWDWITISGGDSDRETITVLPDIDP